MGQESKSEGESKIISTQNKKARDSVHSTVNIKEYRKNTKERKKQDRGNKENSRSQNLYNPLPQTFFKIRNKK